MNRQLDLRKVAESAVQEIVVDGESPFQSDRNSCNVLLSEQALSNQPCHPQVPQPKNWTSIGFCRTVTGTQGTCSHMGSEVCWIEVLREQTIYMRDSRQPVGSSIGSSVKETAYPCGRNY